MLYVKTKDLKIGMRLARPIYNRSGVLLYERDSKLTDQSISSVKNFGLLGLFILEPAEPVPIMTEDDLEFERFQSVEVFAIRDELLAIIQTKQSPSMSRLILDLIRGYGRRELKLNFIQGLRSPEDYLYKHTLNVAILCALMSNVLTMSPQERQDLMCCALVYDIALVSQIEKWATASDEERKEMEKDSAEVGLFILGNTFQNNPGLKRIFVQTHKLLNDFRDGVLPKKRPILPVRILALAVKYDEMTAMNLDSPPASEVETMRFLMDNQEVFDPDAIDALLGSITFLAPGTCIELNTGDKGLVLKSNEDEPLRPMILMFTDNSIIDLSNNLMFGDIYITNIMKTMDNRYIMDIELLKKQGYFSDDKILVKKIQTKEEQHD